MIDQLILKPASKKEVIAASADVVREKIQTGSFTLSDYALLKRAEAAIESMIGVGKLEAIRLYEQYSNKEQVKVDGVEFSYYITKPSLRYSDDEEYKAIEAEIEAVERTLAPLRENLLRRKESLDMAFKMAESGRRLIDDSGEVVPVVGILKKGSQVFKASY